MARILFHGRPINTCGLLPPTGMQAPEFTLRDTDFSAVSLSDVTQDAIVLFVLPSVNAAQCHADIIEFDHVCNTFPQNSVAALCVTMDLPFTLAKFQQEKHIKRTTLLSEFNYSNFGDTYGVRMVDGPYPGLLAKSLFILNKKRQIAYSEQVHELASKPDFADLTTALMETIQSQLESAE